MSWLEDKIESVDDPGAPAATARPLDAEFTPSATKHMLVMYTVNMVCDEGESSSVELRSDAASPPVTVRASAKLDVGAANGDAVTTRQQLTFVVPPTHKVKLVSAGNGVATIAHQTEMVIS